MGVEELKAKIKKYIEICIPDEFKLGEVMIEVADCGDARGEYKSLSQTITISNMFVGELSQLDELRLITTIAHEYRHHFQHQCIKAFKNKEISEEKLNRFFDDFDRIRKDALLDDFKESDIETIKKLDILIYGNKSPFKFVTSKDLDFAEYLLRSDEIDARNFSYQVVENYMKNSKEYEHLSDNERRVILAKLKSLDPHASLFESCAGLSDRLKKYREATSNKELFFQFSEIFERECLDMVFFGVEESSDQSAKYLDRVDLLSEVLNIYLERVIGVNDEYKEGGEFLKSLFEEFIKFGNMTFAQRVVDTWSEAIEGLEDSEQLKINFNDVYRDFIMSNYDKKVFASEALLYNPQSFELEDKRKLLEYYIDNDLFRYASALMKVALEEAENEPEILNYGIEKLSTKFLELKNRAKDESLQYDDILEALETCWNPKLFKMAKLYKKSRDNDGRFASLNKAYFELEDVACELASKKAGKTFNKDYFKTSICYKKLFALTGDEKYIRIENNSGVAQKKAIMLEDFSMGR